MVDVRFFLYLFPVFTFVLTGCSPQQNSGDLYPRLETESPQFFISSFEKDDESKTYINEISHLNSLKDTIYSESN